MDTALRVIRVAISVTSILAGGAVLYHILHSTPEYIEPTTEKCLVPTLAPEDTFLPIPVLDRLVCILVPYFVDSSKTDYGRLITRSLTAFVGPAVYLEMVEGSRLGNSWSLLACMPFTAIFTWSTGVGIYLPVFFVPLMAYARKRILKTSSASRIPLARVYAIYVANALHMASIIFMLGPGPSEVGEANSWIPQSIALNVVLMISLWFIYSPLSWFFGVLMESAQGKVHDVHAAHVAEETKARQLVRDGFLLMAGLNAGLHCAISLAFWGGSTPFQHIVDAFSHSYRVEHIDYAPAYFLMWDLFGAMGGSWLWIVTDTESIVDPVWFVLNSVLFSPGAALMWYAARREQRLMDHAHTLAINHSAKLKTH
ncbi:MAG: hypothetical protein J3Q66DRAFT_345554 [Benniella sp.]|nr:MAG: hypothetical protein J3Q66DRAFT_345554 [Benniella sp.]